MVPSLQLALKSYVSGSSPSSLRRDCNLSTSTALTPLVTCPRFSSSVLRSATRRSFNNLVSVMVDMFLFKVSLAFQFVCIRDRVDFLSEISFSNPLKDAIICKTDLYISPSSEGRRIFHKYKESSNNKLFTKGS